MGILKFSLNPSLLDILEEIKEKIGSYPIVLHGSSSVPQEYIRKFKEFGGEVKDAIGIQNEELKKASKSIVTKINVDTDGRLVFTSCLRENLKNNPKEMDLKKILEYPREEMKKFYSEKIRNIFKTN